MSAAEDTKKGACVPCSSLDPSSLLSKEKVQSLLIDKLPMWTLQPKEGSTGMLSRSFTAKNFQAALNAINSMGAIAESEGHHPDFHLTNYRDVRIDLYTHSVGGITELQRMT